MSFGLARGRQLDITGIGIESADLPDFDREPIIDPRAWFGDRGSLPLEIEIGSGKGTFLVQQAPHQPQVNFLGIEWAGEFFRYAADRVRRNAITNVRLLRADAVEFIRFRCPDAICTVIHLYFPDPWPKKRHHKRRIVQPAFARLVARKLAPGGIFHVATDWAPYAEHMAEVLAAEPALVPLPAPPRARPTSTRFERRGGRLGHAVWETAWQRSTPAGG